MERFPGEASFKLGGGAIQVGCVQGEIKVIVTSKMMQVSRERGQKKKIGFFKLYDRTSVDRTVDRHAQGLDRSTARPTEVNKR